MRVPSSAPATIASPQCVSQSATPCGVPDGIGGQRAQVGRAALPAVTDLRYGDAGRIQPAGLDHQPLHRPRHDGVAAHEGAHAPRSRRARARPRRPPGRPRRREHQPARCRPGVARTSSPSGAGPRSASSRACSPARRGRPTCPGGQQARPPRPCAAAPGPAPARSPPATRRCSVSAVACTTPRSTCSSGSGSDGHAAAPRIRSRTRSTDTCAPSRAALARAPRTRDSAAAWGIRRRSASCQRSAVQASRAAAVASGTPGQRRQGAEGLGDGGHAGSLGFGPCAQTAACRRWPSPSSRRWPSSASSSAWPSSCVAAATSGRRSTGRRTTPCTPPRWPHPTCATA